MGEREKGRNGKGKTKQGIRERERGHKYAGEHIGRRKDTDSERRERKREKADKVKKMREREIVKQTKPNMENQRQTQTYLPAEDFSYYRGHHE